MHQRLMYVPRTVLCRISCCFHVFLPASLLQLDILCSCNAFPYLFSTLLRRPLRTDVENKLKGFLETTLAKSAAPSSPVVAVVKTATAAVCMQLRAAIGAITELINGVEG